MDDARLKKKTRQLPVDEARILRVAAQLFRRKGYDSTTMQDIAGELGILKGSLYHHITSKEDLLIKILSRSVADVLAAVNAAAAADEPPKEKLRSLIRAEVTTMLAHQDEILIWLTERGRNQAVSETIDPETRRTDNALRDVLEEGASSHDWPATDLNLAYQAIRGMLTSVPTWYRPSGRYSPEQIASRFAEYALGLLCGPTAKR
jgi:AcrR family transcriptional regulator